MADQDIKISIRKVYKIFGPDPLGVLERVEQGASKTEILEQTGHTIGIRDVSLEIPTGSTFVIMGLSGSGKSTLIRHINRLIEPTAGEILVDGENVLDLDETALRSMRRHKMSMVFQRFALLPHKTVQQNVAYGLEIAGVEKGEARERAFKQIELVGLGGFENQFPTQLSGGMQQRVGLARALATDAEVLLMDEAFSALDPLIRTDMQDQLKELQANLHKTIVFITHDLDEALRLGDYIAILKDGELRQVGTGEDILLKPADDYVERFVKDVNRGRVVTLGTIVEDLPTAAVGEITPSAAWKAISGSPHNALFLIDGEGRPVAAVTPAALKSLDRGDESKLTADHPGTVPVSSAEHGEVIDEALPRLSETNAPLAVVDESGKLVGGISRAGVVQALARPAEAEEKQPDAESVDPPIQGEPNEISRKTEAVS
jgi:glycine betaine/proline transport system ATP-binding protein